MACIWGFHSQNRQLICFAAAVPHTINASPFGSIYPGGPVQSAAALIDTGATGTCISKRYAQKLNLAPLGKANVHGVSGLAAHNCYLFKIGFPFLIPPGTPAPPGMPPPPQTGPEAATLGQLHLLERAIQGIEFDAANAGFDIIIGMDVISMGSLVVLGNGSFCFSF